VEEALSYYEEGYRRKEQEEAPEPVLISEGKYENITAKRLLKPYFPYFSI